MTSDVDFDRLRLRVQGVGLEIATARRAGELAPIVSLHGFGSTKEDYWRPRRPCCKRVASTAST